MLNLGDIVFVRGEFTSLVDDAIKVGEMILDKQPFAKCYAHAAVYVGGNTVMEAQGFRKSGFANIGDYVGDYDIGHIDMTYIQREKFLSALSNENNLPYDWPGIFWLGVKILTGYDHKYKEHRTRYCSKYIGWALAKADIVVNDETPESLALDSHVWIEKGFP